MDLTPFTMRCLLREQGAEGVDDLTPLKTNQRKTP